MSPLIKPGDYLRIVSNRHHSGQNNSSPPRMIPKVGEIWAYWNRTNEALIVHRVVKVKINNSNQFQCRFHGDALLHPDECGNFIDSERIFGRVEARFRHKQWRGLIGNKNRLLGGYFGILGALNIIVHRGIPKCLKLFRQ